jgi:tetratricopeptide (TPR) repeat protein
MATDGLARRLLWSRLVGFLLMSLLLQAARPALAQSDNKTAARVHFEKGVSAFADRRFAEAAEEFETAYRMSPAYVVLYNIGQVSVALGRSVEAVDAFDKYLRQGASSISAERRQEVLAEIEKQRARIGTISVRTFPEGASIRLDGIVVGRTPLPAPLRVTAGRHSIEALLPKHNPESRELTVEGRANLALELTLEAIAAPPVAAPTPPAPAPREPAAERPFVYIAPAPAAPPPALVERPSERPAPTSSVSIQRIAGIVLLVGGLATATVGGITAYRGSNQANEARDRLATLMGNEWDAAKVDYDAGKSRNQRGWIVAGVGTAVAIGGVVLMATVPERSTSVSLAPWGNAGNGGLAMNVAW